ncbi:MAG: cell division protein FtsZ [Deltaproteobacteria bacterium]|nr:cell division protein FtsZ [Deltaproteobacteria bacterium]
MIEFDENTNLSAKVKIIGIGGGGCNALNTMIEAGLAGVDFIAANTDAQALATSKAPIRIQLGARLTKGLGSGANPKVGKEAAEEAMDQIRDVLDGADMVFVTAGLGGGTGTGGAPIVAEEAKKLGALTVAIVTKPFLFEGKLRQKQAEEGIVNLRRTADTLITIPNQRLLGIGGKTMSLVEAFKKADEVLLHAARGISDLITVPGLINLDFADVRTIMSEMGMALMGTGIASGENRSLEAAQMAICSPLLEDISIKGARGILVNISGDSGVTLNEVNEALTLIQKEAEEEANIIFGVVVDDNMGDELRVTVIATGFGPREEEVDQPLGRVSPVALSVIEERNVPAYIRKRKRDEIRRSAEAHGGRIESFSDFDEDRFDLPTFMRKQAD